MGRYVISPLEWPRLGSEGSKQATGNERTKKQRLRRYFGVKMKTLGVRSKEERC